MASAPPCTNKPVRFFWVRHAPPVNPGNICYGSDMDVDVSMTSALKTQANRLPSGAAWFHTAMPRTLKTAIALASHHPDKPVITFRVASAFNEQSFGSWIGMNRLDLKNHPGYPAYINDPEQVRPPKGESLRDLAARVGTHLESLSKEPGDKIVFAHAGTIRAAIHHATGIALKDTLKLSVDPLSITVIEYDQTRRKNPWMLSISNLKP